MSIITLKRPIFLCICLWGYMQVCSGWVYAQYPQYPKDYFLFPIKPGTQNFLSGNMGELRNNHFHGGLDIKTDQKIGLPVYASADGYVSRILVSSKGYGNALYITHPNGLTTVYAHLEWFKGTIDEYITHYLYTEQCNETDLKIEPGILPVNKGDTVAYSGNSGSSGGPHLHWEIRDQKERVLNPLYFYFEEIKDTRAPFFGKLAIRTLTAQSRVEGQFGRIDFQPQKIGENYELKYPIHAEGWVGIEIQAYDRMDGTTNLYGVQQIDVYRDGNSIFHYDMQAVSFEDNPYINLHIDYETARKKGSLFQKCYLSDGNNLNTYCPDEYGGKIHIKDTLTHRISIHIKDSFGNSSKLNFKLKGTPNQKIKADPEAPKTPGKLSYSIQENTLKVESKGIHGEPSILYVKGRILQQNPSYTDTKQTIYLIDLRQIIPDSIQVGTHKLSLNISESIPASQSITYTHPYMNIQFSKNASFDTLFLSVDYKNLIWRIHDPFTPLLKPILVTLKPDEDIPFKPKSHAYLIKSNGKYAFSDGEWNSFGHLKFRTKVFGEFTIKADTTPPKIRFHKKIGKSFYFKITDDLSGIQHWYAYHEGKFVLMHYDPKYGTINTHYFKDRPFLGGSLVIGAIDAAGNVIRQKFDL